MQVRVDKHTTASTRAKLLKLTIIHESTPSTWLLLTCSNRFSFSNFKHFLTLFSKFFSSFPHGTCSLSVSRKYLALDEIYHPLSASSPRSTTLRTYPLTLRTPRHRRDSHPLWCLVPKDLDAGRHRSMSLDHNALDLDRPELFSLSYSRFTRRYWGNHCYFLFLRLVICLNSAGRLTSFEIRIKKTFFSKDEKNLSHHIPIDIRFAVTSQRKIDNPMKNRRCFLPAMQPTNQSKGTEQREQV